MPQFKPIPSRLFIMTVWLFSLSVCNCGSPKSQVTHDNSNAVSNAPMKALSEPAAAIDPNIRSMFQDSRGYYWIGTNGAGVYRYDAQNWTQFTVMDGLADNQVIHIQEDKAGNIWFGSGSFGFSKFDGKAISSMADQATITEGTLADWNSKPGELWFYGGGGVFRCSTGSLDYLPFAPSISQKTAPRTLSRYGVYAILQDSKGNVWFGTQAEGVCRYDGKKLTWLKEKGLAGPAVLGLYEDSKGELWFGNNGAGLFRCDGKVLTNVTEEKGLGNPDFRASSKPGPGTMARVYAVNEDRQGNLWIGTVDAGVWKYDGSKMTNYTTQDGLPSNAVNTIFKDRNGKLWFGTDAHGICVFDGARFKPQLPGE